MNDFLDSKKITKTIFAGEFITIKVEYEDIDEDIPAKEISD